MTSTRHDSQPLRWHKHQQQLHAAAAGAGRWCWCCLHASACAGRGTAHKPLSSPTCVTLSQPGGLAPGGSSASQASLLHSARLRVPWGRKVWRARSAGPMACQRLRACQPQASGVLPRYSRQVGALGEEGRLEGCPGHLQGGRGAVMVRGGRHDGCCLAEVLHALGCTSAHWRLAA